MSIYEKIKGRVSLECIEDFTVSLSKSPSIT